MIAVYLLPEEKSREEIRARSVKTTSQWVLQSLGQAKYVSSFS